MFFLANKQPFPVSCITSLLALLAVVFCSQRVDAVVANSDINPILPIGYATTIIKHGRTIVTNTFDSVSPNSGILLDELLPFADKGDTLEFSHHHGGSAFTAVADFNRVDDSLHWLDQQSGKILDGVEIEKYSPVITWDRKSYREDAVSFAGKVSTRFYPSALEDGKVRFSNQLRWLKTIDPPFPVPGNKVFKIVLKNGNVLDVFFDIGTRLLLESKTHKPLNILPDDIAEYREPHPLISEHPSHTQIIIQTPIMNEKCGVQDNLSQEATSISNEQSDIQNKHTQPNSLISSWMSNACKQVIGEFWDSEHPFLSLIGWGIFLLLCLGWKKCLSLFGKLITKIRKRMKRLLAKIRKRVTFRKTSLPEKPQRTQQRHFGRKPKRRRYP